jgi:GTPase-activating protein BEM2
MVELGQDELYRLLPPALRSGLRAHHVLRKWLIAELVAPRLGVQARQARMDLFLQAVEICRLRSEGDSLESIPLERRCVRSFAEYVITSAILSPESRTHTRPWTNIASGRGVSTESLLSYLSRTSLSSPARMAGPPLISDLGWLLERMLEVLSLPDTFESGSEMGRVINFDKRRYFSTVLNDDKYGLMLRLGIFAILLWNQSSLVHVLAGSGS